jgi:hypothetical protein
MGDIKKRPKQTQIHINAETKVARRTCALSTTTTTLHKVSLPNFYPKRTHMSDMHHHHQSPSAAASGSRSKRRVWTRNQRAIHPIQVQTTATKPEAKATISECEEMLLKHSDTTVQRRASIQTTPFVTPSTTSVEWASTQSCPSPALSDSAVATQNTHLPTPNTVNETNPITPRSTFDVEANNQIAAAAAAAAAADSTMSSSSQHQLFSTLADHDFFIPPSASINNASLILFKNHTPSLDRFRMLHNQLFIELGRVVEEQLQPCLLPEANAQAYKLKEDVMLGLLTDVMPALNHFIESVGKEVKTGMQKHRAGLRLWAGERGQKNQESK